jgi:putrescine aminotransferase
VTQFPESSGQAGAPPKRTPVSRLWHPFADMAKVAGHELVIVKGEGVWVVDREGRRYLDGSGALWYCNVGHGRTELAEAASRQMKQLACYQVFDRMANEPALSLADELSRIAPTGADSSVFLVSGGSDAVESAAKIARRYWAAQGTPERTLIASREGGYHGMHGFGTSLSGIASNSEGWGPLVEHVSTVPRDDPQALRTLFEESAGRVAAFIAEPVQGAAGVYPPTPTYWEEVQSACQEHDVLLIVDEVVCGFGRLGRWFGSDRFRIKPDLVAAAKGLSSGYMPIGAVLASSRVTDVVYAAGDFRHGYTYSGHPAACAVALANMEIIRSEGLADRVTQLEPEFAAAFAPLLDHPAVSDVRTAGFLAGVELDENARAEVAELMEMVLEAMRQRGVLVRGLLGRTIQISPPLIIETDQLALLATALEESLTEVLDNQSASGQANEPEED